MFRSLKSEKKQTLIKSMNLKLYENENTTIFDIGDVSDKIYIIRSGIIQIKGSNGQNLRKLYKNDIFGERGLFNQLTRTAKAITLSNNTELIEVSNNDFAKCMDSTFISWMERRNNIYNIEITLNDLTIIKKLGHGNYGHVLLV